MNSWVTIATANSDLITAGRSGDITFIEFRQEIYRRRPLRTDDRFGGIIAFNDISTQHHKSLNFIDFFVTRISLSSRACSPNKVERFAGIIAAGIVVEILGNGKKISAWQGAPV